MDNYYFNSMMNKKRLNEDDRLKALKEQTIASTLSDMPESISSAPSSSSSGSGMGTVDWVGLGVQAAGAISGDLEDARLREEEERKAQEQKFEEQRRQAVQDRQTAKQLVTENQMAERSQNMAGLNYLADQRARAMQNRTAFSFNKNFARALKGR